MGAVIALGGIAVLAFVMGAVCLYVGFVEPEPAALIVGALCLATGLVLTYGATRVLDDYEKSQCALTEIVVEVEDNSYCRPRADVVEWAER